VTVGNLLQLAAFWGAFFLAMFGLGWRWYFALLVALAVGFIVWKMRGGPMEF
jgi:hypothetical protein